jgi:polysaccharide biosynthesis protein PslG
MRKEIAAALAGIGIFLAVVATPAAAVPRDLFGLTKGKQALDGQDLNTIRSTGVRTFRFVLDWSGTQPNQGAPPNFVPIDRFVGDLAAKGIRPLPFVYGSPSWIAKSPNRPPLGSPRKQRAWRQFLAAAVTRYEPGGTYWTGGGPGDYQQQHPGASPKPITAWQIWNEPNLPKYFVRKNLTRKYAKLVKISNAAISGADPQAKVVLAGLTGYAKPRGWTLLDHLYDIRGIKRRFDVAALHPYAATIGQFRTELKKMHQVMKQHHDGGTALWLTEVGWGSSRGSRRFPLNKGLQGQKRMLRRSFKFVLRKRRALSINRVLWFQWRDPAGGGKFACSFCDSAGLLRHNREPKPAYRAFKSFTR